MFNRRSREGYLLIDHRASPGTDAVPEGSVMEAPTYTCGHCNRIVVINPDRTRARGYCRGCDHVICDPCSTRALTFGCEPVEKKMDTAQEAFLRGQPLGGPIFG